MTALGQMLKIAEQKREAAERELAEARRHLQAVLTAYDSAIADATYWDNLDDAAISAGIYLKGGL